MKANEAPDKIYMPNELLSEEWQRHIEGEDTEYVRTDVFIEKAVQFIKDPFQFEDTSWYKDGEPTVKNQVIEDFRNYMKGE